MGDTTAQLAAVVLDLKQEGPVTTRTIREHSQSSLRFASLSKSQVSYNLQKLANDGLLTVQQRSSEDSGHLPSVVSVQSLQELEQLAEQRDKVNVTADNVNTILDKIEAVESRVEALETARNQ